MPHTDPLPNRRDVLKSAAAATLLPSLGFSPHKSDLIREENAKPGTRDWLNTNVRIDPKTKYRSPWIEGFASKTSVRHGEEIKFYVSTNPASPFTINLYRLGYYNGDGARLVQKFDAMPGIVQPDPPIGEMRLRECQWEPCVTLKIPQDWTSGVYLGQLTEKKENLQSYIIFVVRDDRKADFLYQVSDNTWNAYNRWPSQFSLYDDGKKEWYWGPDVRVSYDRPYGKYCQILNAPLSVGSGEYLLWEFPFAFWMERQGYDLTYISNVDTHADAAGLKRAKAWLSIGHDEYWSREMFANMLQAVQDGLNLGFFSGNAICGVTPYGASADGRPHRTITRVGKYSGPEKWEVESGFEEELRFKENGPNEATLMGARNCFPVTGGADWTCRKPDHWIFAGTGMKEGDSIPGLVGWEFHGDPAKIPGLEVIASGKTKSPRGEGIYTATLYPGPKGNQVFNAATIWWGDGLSEPPGYVRPSVYTTPKGPVARVQKITANILDKLKS